MRRISTPYGTRFIEADDRGGIHEYLLQCAADIANASPDLPMPMKRRGIRPFREGDYLSGLEYLTLEIVEGALGGIPARQRKKTVKQLHQIGTDALRQAILDNKEIFVGLIVGEARKGLDYFEPFQQMSDAQ